MRSLKLENNCRKFHDDKQCSLQLCEGRSYVQSIRKIFSSEDIGITLIGSLKVSGCVIGYLSSLVCNHCHYHKVLV